MEFEWLGVTAWGWFMLLAIVGQFWPLAGKARQVAESEQASSVSRFASNMLLTASDLLVAFLMPATAIFGAWLGQTADLGLLRQLDLPVWSQLVLAFVLSDLLLYAVHRLAHSWSFYWRFHRVHHSDVELDVLTTYRQHPAASFIAGWLQAMAIVALGLDAAGVAAYQLVIAFQNPLHHANLAWPIPKAISHAACWLFVTPGQHALHHSAQMSETNSNFGQLFSLWDRLFKTLRYEGRDHLENLEIGLGEKYARGASHIGSQLVLPLAPLDGPNPKNHSQD